MSELTYWDYLNIALCLFLSYYIVKILDKSMTSIIDSYLGKKTPANLHTISLQKHIETFYIHIGSY